MGGQRHSPVGVPSFHWFEGRVGLTEPNGNKRNSHLTWESNPGRSFLCFDLIKNLRIIKGGNYVPAVVTWFPCRMISRSCSSGFPKQAMHI